VHINPHMAATISPPVMVARRWLAMIRPATEASLINMSQAAPVLPPPPSLCGAIARAAVEQDAVHVYGPVLGLAQLREVLAAQWSVSYGGRIARDQVAITSGCNQAFTAAMAVLAAPGDNVVITTPWYFNHKMGLDMAGIAARELPVEEDMQPHAERAASLIDARTRALVLITPNNPTGCEYGMERIMQFYELAQQRGIALVVDETYRDFRSSGDRPHAIFTDPDWAKTLVHLYSFSKSFRLTGHRVGALVASQRILDEVEKYLDTVTICPNQLGQHAALYGLANLGAWLAGERHEILRRKQTLETELAACDGWRLLGCGAYFAYIGHEGAVRSDTVAQQLLRAKNVLALPDTMFLPDTMRDGPPFSYRSIRFAYANIDCDGIVEFARRLADFEPGALGCEGQDLPADAVV